MPQFQVLPQNPTFGQQFGQQLGAGLGQGLNQGIAQRLENFQKQQKISDLEQTYEAQGYPKDLAKLAATATTGGNTEILKNLLELRQRGFSPIGAQQSQQSQSPMPQVSDEIAQAVKSAKDSDIGLTPKERISRQSERYKTGLPVSQEASTKLRSMTRDKERIDILERLNESAKLPKGLGRLNVDSEGNLRLPFLASPESQRFIKTLNEFSAGAKDTFGSRVTNFDLQQYLQRFPTLLNSKEGRAQIVQQMKIVNDINSLYYKNLKKVFDEAGGARYIDADKAESIAEKRTEPEISKLVKKFDEIGQFSSLPNAALYKGKKVFDDETGETLESDGENWVPVK